NPEIQVVAARVQPEDDESPGEPASRAEMLFTLEDVEFADLIAGWLRLTHVYSAACNIFFGLQYGPPAYIDMTFGGVVQSLSLYYTRREDGIARRANEEQRLKEIIASLPPGGADWVVDRVGARPYPPFREMLGALVREHADAMNPLVSSRHDR